MKKIWQKKEEQWIPEIIEKYTVGNDYILDIKLLPYDIKGSHAHAKMLNKIWVLTNSELQILTGWLDALNSIVETWGFKIDVSQEDGHSAIEYFLTKNYWEVWKKIHTGRSRNDQILVTMRLYSLDMIDEIEEKINFLLETLKDKIEEIWDTQMPWYTHTQKAMPTTAWLWLGMYTDCLEDTKIFISAAKKVNNQNPLWSAAGYWDAWFWLDREYTTKDLWFDKTQKNPIYCGYSRWKFEYMILQTLSHIMLDIWKMANEFIYFSSSEFDFFTLPDWFKTGSSIMPQKKNMDVAELIRGNTNLFLWYEFQIREIYKILFMGYNRDFQLTKEPYMKGIELVSDTLEVMTLIVKNIQVNTDKLENAMTWEMYATEEAYRLVKKGMSFRDAYIKVWNKYI